MATNSLLNSAAASEIHVTSTYQYQPLGDGDLQIRLLTLDPADSWTSEISCCLTHVKLDLKTKFEALSYTWNDGAETEPMILNGKRRLVASNLESFLRHRREKEDSVHLWVDAICINQADLIEKGQQVQIMNLIYATAAKVMVWLGPAAEESDLAMEELRKLGGGSPFDKMPILTGDVLRALENLLNRRWWYRIWILQEVVWGGGGRKINDMRVRCGGKEVRWTNLVIAAARMQAHKDDQRQYFPSVGNILTLEELRNQAEGVITNPANESSVLDLVSTHRHFKSTDPRDKIYALLGMALGKNRQPFSGIKIDYSASICEVYKSFALLILQSGLGVEVLRHCHARSVETLPSWAPDWSVCTAETPLPSNKCTKPRKEPWWGRPLKKTYGEQGKNSGKNRTSYEFRSNNAPKLEHENEVLSLNSKVSDTFRISTLPKSLADTLPPELKGSMQDIIDRGHLVIDAKDEEEDELMNGNLEDPERIADVERLAISKGEKVTQQRTESKIAAASIGPPIRYQAGGDTKTNIVIDPETDVLVAHGVLWDTIDEIHSPFPSNVEANWENSTYFMVAIGQCKQFSLLNYTGQNPYHTSRARTEAFWLTLFAGRTTISNKSGLEINIKDDMQFQEWLPEISKSWNPSVPPVTVVNSGRLETAEISIAVEPNLNELGEILGMHKNELQIQMPGAAMLTNLQPEEWTDKDRAYYSAKFQELALLWQKQSFDLYHRPFRLPTVIPDPYWNMRQNNDKVAMAKSRSGENSDFIASFQVLHPTTSSEVRQWFDRTLENFVPIIPKDALEPNFEKYALGRRFFMTKKGYLGLGPHETRKGDRICIFLGSDVPFILRKRPQRGFELVGETYIHGIMGGEVIEEWRKGKIEVGKVNIH